MTKKESNVSYRIIDGSLSIEHHILLQQLTFRKKSKDGTEKTYYSYFIKLPWAVYNLLEPTDDTVYLKQDDDSLIELLHESDDNSRKVKIQLDNKSLTDDTSEYRYKLTIPKKFIENDSFIRGQTYITLTITSKNNKYGYYITLKQD